MKLAKELVGPRSSTLIGDSLWVVYVNFDFKIAIHLEYKSPEEGTGLNLSHEIHFYSPVTD